MNFARLRWIVALTGAIVAALLAVATAHLIERSRSATRKIIDTTLEQNSRATEGIVNRHLLQVDSALARIPMLFSEGMHDSTNPRNISTAKRLLQSLNFQSFVFRDLMIADGGGNIWVTGRARTPNWKLPVDEVNSAAAAGSSAIVGPVRNPLSGDWVWYIARPVTIGNTRDMYAIAEVPIASLASALANHADVPGIRITLERRNGQILASFPHDELAIGKSGGDGSQSQSTTNMRQPASDPHGNTAIYSATRTSLNPDLGIRVSLRHAVAFKDANEDRAQFIMAAAGGLALILALVALTFAILRREERLETERQAAQSNLSDAIEAMSDGFVMWDPEDRLVTCNARYREMYAQSAEAMHEGARFEDIIRFGFRNGQYPGQGDDLEAFVERASAIHRTAAGSAERLLPDGRWVMITDRRTSNGGIVGIRTDVTEMKWTLNELSLANARIQEALHDIGTRNILFDAALNNMSQGLLMVDADQLVIVRNRRLLELLGLDGWKEGEALDLSGMFAMLQRADRFAPAAAEKLYFWQSNLSLDRNSGTYILEGHHGLYISVVQRPLDTGGFVATYEDVSNRQAAEKQISFLAHHDALTGLPNRVVLHAGIESRLASVGRNGAGLAVLYIDLDKFKDVNDSMGHPIGDALLTLVAHRLRSCLRLRDLVARIGGDEFAVAISGTGVETQAPRLADEIIRSLSAPYDIQEKPVRIGASVGIAFADSKKQPPIRFCARPISPFIRQRAAIAGSMSFSRSGWKPNCSRGSRPSVSCASP